MVKFEVTRTTRKAKGNDTRTEAVCDFLADAVAYRKILADDFGSDVVHFDVRGVNYSDCFHEFA